jgi:hypothetical protein
MVPVTAVAVVGAAMLFTPEANASGSSSRVDGCYSKWWSTASASYCEPATVRSSFQNQYRCNSGFWYAGDFGQLNAGEWKQGFSQGECTFSVEKAYTANTGPW